MDLSIVVPLYNEEDNVEPLCRRLYETLRRLPHSWEIILVDDGSTDRTWSVATPLLSEIPYLRLIRLRRNFGQTAALSAGFHHARGAVIVTMDGDLQNDPEDIPLLLERMDPDTDVVSGWRKDRRDPLLTRRLPSRLANFLISRITGVYLHDYGCTLKAYRRDVIQHVHLYGEMHRFIPALASWVGGRVREVVVRHHPRHAGKSKYGLARTLRVLLDLITVKFLLHYSRGPMQMFGKIGAIFALPGLCLVAFMVLAHLSFRLFGTSVGGDLIKRPFWVITSFMLIAFGVQFISIGLLAEVQIRTYHESQSRPTYFVREILASEDRRRNSRQHSLPEKMP
ncbi:MAG TPA: glycosyltransferase [Kiritimatiellae bacterium]|nr:glycosyltransferase [Kiritimatiellia bacterium]